MIFKVLFLYVFLSCVMPVSAQSNETLPRGYKDIHIGMDVDAVKAALVADYIFGYRGERDVSLLPTENRSLIETSGSNWLDRCWFQFYEDILYTIIINFNPEKIDYYSVYMQLSEKYGDPTSLSPEQVLWENDETSLSLERPVSVKYIDKAVFNDLLNKSTVEQAAVEQLRANILGDL